MLDSLWLAPASVTKMISDPQWVDHFFNEFDSAAKKLLENNYSDDDLFSKRILNAGDISYLQYRESIRRWMELAWRKGRSLLTIFDHLPNDLERNSIAQSRFGHIELGPIDSDVAERLTNSELDEMRDASIIRGYSRDAILNTCGYFISELFFSFESMCRVICMGSCLEIFLKTTSPKITLQHTDIFKALNQLSKHPDYKIACQICKASMVCESFEIFKSLRDFYLLIYHLRVIRDYKTEYYSASNLANKLLDIFLPLGFDVICKTESLMSLSIGNKMHFPISLSDEKSHIERITSLLKTK